MPLLADGLGLAVLNGEVLRQDVAGAGMRLIEVCKATAVARAPPQRPQDSLRQ